jgi:hypothetical protein
MRWTQEAIQDSRSPARDLNPAPLEHSIYLYFLRDAFLVARTIQRRKGRYENNKLETMLTEEAEAWLKALSRH